MTITEATLQHLQTTLEKALITDIDGESPDRAGAVKIGQLQGDPDVDLARISVEIYPNDPQKPGEWEDEIIEWEMPRTAIWSRKFCILYRALLADSREDLDESVNIASVIKDRIEYTLNSMDYTGVSFGTERIIGCPVEHMLSEISQGGGPEEYDWSGKILFEVLTSASYR